MMQALKDFIPPFVKPLNVKDFGVSALQIAGDKANSSAAFQPFIDRPDDTVTCSCCKGTNGQRLQYACKNADPLRSGEDCLCVSENNQHHKRDANADEESVVDIVGGKVRDHGDKAAEQVRDAHDQSRDPSTGAVWLC